MEILGKSEFACTACQEAIKAEGVVAVIDGPIHSVLVRPLSVQVECDSDMEPSVGTYSRAKHVNASAASHDVRRRRRAICGADVHDEGCEKWFGGRRRQG